MNSTPPLIRRVLESCLYAENLEETAAFYEKTLGLERIAEEAGRHVFFRCGPGVFLLFNPKRTAKPLGDVPTHGAHGPGHLAFAIAEADLSVWRERLLRAGVEIEVELHWPNGGRSIYFRDPAGNSIELATPRLWGYE
ncbi:MAG: glyoxalase/bleomycin resistance/extradiol dioxygenase family protein [Chloroflexi bacterium]|nr:glyoxalase/bleomycin resistance/extradiol dioxygenase family protein [Chloroflexota bacterium]